MKVTYPVLSRTGFSRLEIIFASTAAFILLLTLFYFARLEYARAHRAACMNHLRLLGQAIRVYVNENDGAWPMAEQWINRRIADKPLPGCPSAVTLPPYPDGPKFQSPVSGYAYNGHLNGDYQPLQNSQIAFPGQTVSVCEEANDVITTIQVNPFAGHYTSPKGREEGFKRHHGGANYLFCDGHARWYLPNDIHPGGEWDTNNGSVPSFAIR